MADKMNIFNCVGNTIKSSSNANVEDFIINFKNYFPAGCSIYSDLWSGIRSYWFARMLQLAFGCGIIIKELDGETYFWQSPTGSVFDKDGRTRGHILEHVDDIPSQYTNLSPIQFIEQFVGDRLEESAELRIAFGGQYAWYFANFICDCVSSGEVCFVVDNSGKPFPICRVSQDVGYTIYGEQDLKFHICITSNELGASLDHLRFFYLDEIRLSKSISQVISSKLLAEHSVFEPHPAGTSDIMLPMHLLDIAWGIAENIHNAWAKQRVAEGWVYGIERDARKKTTPLLVPFNELPEAEKEHNLAVAIETLKYIETAGYQITKRGD